MRGLDPNGIRLARLKLRINRARGQRASLNRLKECELPRPSIERAALFHVKQSKPCGARPEQSTRGPNVSRETRQLLSAPVGPARATCSRRVRHDTVRAVPREVGRMASSILRGSCETVRQVPRRLLLDRAPAPDPDGGGFRGPCPGAGNLSRPRRCVEPAGSNRPLIAARGPKSGKWMERFQCRHPQAPTWVLAGPVWN